MNTPTTASRIQDYFTVILAQAREAMYEREDDIQKAWNENIAEAQANEKDTPPLKLSIGAVVDLEKHTIHTTLRFTAVYTSTIGGLIPDPDQMELDLGNVSVSFHPVTTTEEEQP